MIRITDDKCSEWYCSWNKDGHCMISKNSYIIALEKNCPHSKEVKK